jgi:hypothetical protein
MLQAGLHEITVTYLWSLGYFLVRDTVLLNDWYFGKANANGGSRVYSLLSLVLYLSVRTLPP